jgi:hypothetical protein
MLRYVALVRTDVSEELGASFIRVTRIGEPRTTLAVTSNRRRNIPEDTIVMSPMILSESEVCTPNSCSIMSLAAVIHLHCCVGLAVIS